MPIVPNQVSGFVGYQSERPEPPEEPTLGETWGAGFRLENDVVNAWQLLNQPSFERDDNFDLVGTLKERGYWDTYRENFIGVYSLPEFNHVAAKIEQEQADRDTLSRAGWAGTVAMIGAGVLSPTMAFPLLGPARGLKGVLQAAALGGVAGAAQEIPLMANQLTRSPGESAFAISASTVLGGLLGGAVLALRKGEMGALEQGMANVPMNTTVRYAPAGAEVTARPDATLNADGTVGGLASGANRMANVLDSNAITRSPLTDNLTSDFAEARWMTAQLGDGGLSLPGNAALIPTTPGGTAETAINAHYGKYATFIDRANDAYYKYMFDEQAPKLFPGTRAYARHLQDRSRMSRSEFNTEVFRASYSDGVHPNSYVAEAAKAARELIYDPILKDLQDVKLLAAELKESADPSYINWVFNHEKVSANPVRFIDFLQQKYVEKLNADFSAAYEKMRLRTARVEETIGDMNRSPEEIEILRDQFGAQLKELDKRMEAQHFTALEDTIGNLRAQAAALKEDKGLLAETTRKQMLKDAKDMEVAAGPKYADAKLERRELKRRLSNLNKAKVVVEERLANKLEKIERAEELSTNSLNRVARAGQKFLNEMENWSDEVLDEELSKLKTQFAAVAKIYDKGEERLVKLLDEENPDPVFAVDLEYLQRSRADRMTTTAEKIADAEDLGRDAMRSLINDMLQEVIQKVQRLNDRRAVRTARLREQAQKLTPEATAAREAELRGKITNLEDSFNERARILGGAGPKADPLAGKADFTDYAREQATKTKDRVLGTTLRLPIVDMMLEERGAVLPRLLGFIPTSEMEEFLETDIEHLIRTHLRTMAPDIEITRKFGSVNGEEQFARLVEEFNQKLETIAKSEESDSWKARETRRVTDEFNRVKGNTEAIINRLRHLHGIPRDPDGLGYRAAKTLMDLNVLRYMGMVTAASIPDVAKPIMRYGVTHAFKEGFIPFVTRMKELKPLIKELKYFGVGIETATAMRTHQIMDTMDDFRRGTKFERSVQYLSGKQGIVAGFNIWTDVMKVITGMAANAKVMDLVGQLGEGKKLTAKDNTFLASNGIDEDIALRIWKEVQNGGASKINGTWIPNTQSWQDPLARRAFQNAVLREASNQVVTPGIEKPLWTTASTTGKMLAQFKSFAFSSTTKTLMAGLQQRDRAVAEGIAASLALGMFSYYVSSMLGSDSAREKMMNAELDEWADQAIERSGLLAVFGLGQDLLSRIPATAPYVSFSGGRTTRRGGDDLTEALLGPSFDALMKASQIASGFDDPTKSTAHQLRLLMPWQNTIGLREIYDTLEAHNGLKERRQ